MSRYMLDMLRRARGDRRNPYGSRGGYVVSSRRGRDMRMEEDMRRNQDYMPYDYEKGGRGNMAGGSDYYGDMDMARNGRDGHYPMQGRMYQPIEAMGYFNGYYGIGEEDFARGGRGSDNLGGRDYYGDYAGDYGERLSKEELDKWCKKLMHEVEETDKHFFSKELVAQKAKQMNIQMDMFNEDELLIAMLLIYTDYGKILKPYVGTNMDLYIPLGKAFLTDEDSEVKGGEKLAIYYDVFADH